MPIRTEPVTINIGPQHPSTHGVLRLRVTFDGEVIVDVEPIFGYLHRGSEKLAEERNYVQVLTLTDRLDYVASMTNNQAYCLAVEKLMGVEVPERAQYLRVMTAELQRMASHLVAAGFLLQDLGALATPLMYCFRFREKILDLFEMLCGARITVSYMRPGGVFADAPEDFWPALDRLMGEAPELLGELEQLLMENEIVLVRTKNVGVLPLDTAIAYSISGPVLRASGLPWDWRKADPYDVYDRMQFDIPIGDRGDNYDRFRVRIEEVKQSMRIVSQCVEQMPPGPIRTELPFVLRPPAGAEAYGRVEAPKGELGFYMVSDGSIAPYRCKIRSPSLINLTVLKELLVGWKLADMIVTLGSIDINMGEVDR
ncbi:MAG: NADH-quinone oxidoreductase subunit D [Dehalococcoidia bacterium]